jgi:hypothetical protein
VSTNHYLVQFGTVIATEFYREKQTCSFALLYTVHRSVHKFQFCLFIGISRLYVYYLFITYLNIFLAEHYRRLSTNLLKQLSLILQCLQRDFVRETTTYLGSSWLNQVPVGFHLWRLKTYHTNRSSCTESRIRGASGVADRRLWPQASPFFSRNLPMPQLIPDRLRILLPFQARSCDVVDLIRYLLSDCCSEHLVECFARYGSMASQWSNSRS